MIQRPAFLKIDVQGYELEVLKGSCDVLDCIDLVYVECSFIELYAGQALAHHVIEWLLPYGFSLSAIYNLSTDRQGQAVQADFLFSRAIESSESASN